MPEPEEDASVGSGVGSVGGTGAGWAGAGA